MQGDAMDKMTNPEMMSALADGQLRGEAFARGVEAAAADPAARAAWHDYHLIGDVLRSAELAAAPSAAFMARLSARLAEEPAPAIQSIAATPQPIGATAGFGTENEAANDGSFRWKMVAGFASMAAVAAIGWGVVAGGVGGLSSGQPQLASAPAGTVLAGSQQGVMIRDARLDELLAAHRQFGGAAAVQMPAGFVRNATFEGPAR